MNYRAILTVAILPLVFLAACDNEKDIDPPAELVEFKAKIQVKELWSNGLGGDMENLRLGLRPATDDTRIYAVSHDGQVRAFNPANGREQWRVRTKLPLSGGPGVGGGHVVAGSSEGDVIALSAEDGAKQWQVHVGGEVLAPPAVGDSIVVVRTVDGRLHGLNAADGSEKWVNEQNVPRLSLRGTAAPIIVGDAVIAGFDNGKVVALNLADGETRWDTAVAPSRGRTEIERLVDIDSPVRVVDKDVYVVGFQGRVAMLALDSGQIWWAHDASSNRGLTLDQDNLYISTAEGSVIALRRRDGAPVWEQKALHRRALSGPALDGSTIVVADFEGYVHWLDSATGELLAREKVGGNRVTNTPLVADGKVFVLTDGGKLAAFQRGATLTVSDADKKADARAVEEAEKKRQEKIEKAKKAAKEKANKSPAPEIPDRTDRRRSGGY